MPEKQSQRLRLVHGSLMYRDKRLEGFDAAALSAANHCGACMNACLEYWR